MAAFRTTVFGVLCELTSFHPGFPIRAAQLVLEQLETIKPVFDVRTARHDPCLVPITDGLEVSRRGGIESVCGASASQSCFVVRGFDVVEQLVFGGAPIEMIVFFSASVENATVARFANLPFEFQLEVTELVFRHDVADRRFLREGAIDDMPTVRNLI